MKKITQESLDEMYEILDTMDSNNEYYPSVEDLKHHDVEGKLNEGCMAAYLLWLQESIPNGIASDQEKEASRYISDIFAKAVC